LCEWYSQTYSTKWPVWFSLSSLFCVIFLTLRIHSEPKGEATHVRLIRQTIQQQRYVALASQCLFSVTIRCGLVKYRSKRMVSSRSTWIWHKPTRSRCRTRLTSCSIRPPFRPLLLYVVCCSLMLTVRMWTVYSVSIRVALSLPDGLVPLLCYTFKRRKRWTCCLWVNALASKSFAFDVQGFMSLNLVQSLFGRSSTFRTTGLYDLEFGGC
jgi:hypothetical protein